MKKTILMLSANPRDGQFLQLRREYEIILEKTRANVQYDPQARIETLLQVIEKNQPHIVHFSGHGSEEGIYLLDQFDEARLFSRNAASRIFQLFKNQVECVVLNACYAETVAAAINKHIPTVIGMSHKISDAASLAFTEGFYAGIGSKASYPRSFAFGCAQIAGFELPYDCVPILKHKEPLRPFYSELSAALERQKQDCENRNVEFRTPHMLHVVLESAEKPFFMRAFKQCNASLFEDLCDRTRQYIDKPQSQSVGREFRTFGWEDREEVQAANNEAIREEEVVITARHLMLGILVCHNSISKFVKAVLKSPEQYNILIANLRGFHEDISTSSL